MNIFKLKPWPFKIDEVAELYWICSPFQNQHGNWMIKSIFKYNNKLCEVELPWGTLPYLRLGYKYKDGIASSSNKKGFIGQININNTNFEICTSFDMPSQLIYFYKNREYGMQKLCRFKICERTYFIPCIELIRAFFAKSTMLTNYLLKPNGLDFLIESSKIINNCLYLNMSIEVPKKNATIETASILGWIKYNEEAFESWASVYGNIYSNKDNSRRFIEMLPPVRNNSKWAYRGISSGGNNLILELTSFTGLRTPFEYIKFSHPEIERNRYFRIDGKIKRGKLEKDDIYELHQDGNGQGTRKQQNQTIVRIEPTQFIYENIKTVEKVNAIEKNTLLGTMVLPQGKCFQIGNIKSPNLVSTEDWSSEGKIQPIEFNTLEVVKGQVGKGLESFYKLILYISRKYQQLRISMMEAFLPEGNRFSYFDDGSRRTCAILKIETGYQSSSYVIEIGRIDKWPISTLIIHSKEIKSNNEIEVYIQKQLNRLIQNGGHWDTKLLSNYIAYNYEMAKHTSNKDLYDWSYRIIEKINRLNYYQTGQL